MSLYVLTAKARDIIGDVVLPVPGARHNRSRSDIVGSFAQKMMNENAGKEM